MISNVGWDIRPLFERDGYLDAVDTFTLSYENGAQKPDRQLFELACSTLCKNPNEVLMVGDDPATDGGAVVAGFPTYLLPRPVPGEPRGLDVVLDLVLGSHR